MINSDYITTIEYNLAQLKALQENTREKFAELNDHWQDALLESVTTKGNVYYCLRKRGATRRVYLGGESNRDVQSIKEYMYLKRLRRDLESEIRLLDNVILKHRTIDFAGINSRLPKVYRSTGYRDVSVKEHKAEEWKAAKEAEKACYSVKNPESLIMTALDGTPMRSKSEVIIANMLINNGIPYVYELPHMVNGVLIYTDFTVLSLIDCETEVLLEHEGMMDKGYYQRIFLDKTNSYLAADIVPGKDVFFTFDDLHGGFDPSPVRDIIETRLKPKK